MNDMNLFKKEQGWNMTSVIFLIENGILGSLDA